MMSHWYVGVCWGHFWALKKYFHVFMAFMSLKIGNPDPKHGSVKVDLRRFQIKTVKAQARE